MPLDIVPSLGGGGSAASTPPSELTYDPGWVSSVSVGEASHTTWAEEKMTWAQLSAVTDQGDIDFRLYANEQFPMYASEDRPLAAYESVISEP
jgi:hypothetical protein